MFNDPTGHTFLIDVLRVTYETIRCFPEALNQFCDGIAEVYVGQTRT